MIRALLTLDLLKSEDERTEFYAILRKKKWQKTKDVETVWTLTFKNLDPSIEGTLKKAKNAIRDTLLETVKDLKLKEVSYIVQIGNHRPISRVIRKKDGEYKCFSRELYPPKKD